MAGTNIVVLFILCFTIVLLVNTANKLLFFTFGSGDLFYSIYNSIRADLGILDLVMVDKLAQALMFMGSFYGTIIKTFFFVLSITFHAAIMQFILHIFMRPPARFSVSLGIFYTTSIFFYILNLVPYIGGAIFSFTLLIYVSRGIAGVNGFSRLRGFLLAISPLLFLPLAGFILLVSVFKVFSLF
jgi:hypothetical protein